MRYAILSDLHANLRAWNAVSLDLASAGAERIVCLGDVVGYGPCPAEVMESVYTRVHHFVLGNHDAVLCGKMDPGSFHESARQSLAWTRNRLPEAARRIPALWPLTLRGPGFRCAHGEFSAPALFRYVLDPDDARASWSAVADPLLFVGHSHCPGLFVLGPSGTPHGLPPQDFELEPGKRYLVNVGSVGQPRDGDPRASYCLYDSTLRTVTWRRIPFDLDGYRDDLERAGLSPDASPFLRFDPRNQLAAIRPEPDFRPPDSPKRGARGAIAVQEIDSLKKRVRTWRRTALALTGLAAFGLLAAAALLWMRHRDRPIVHAAATPLPIVAADYPEGANLLAWPEAPAGPLRTVPGWNVRLGNGRRQSLYAETGSDGPTVLRLHSGTDERPFFLESSAIRAEPGRKFTAEALIRKSPGFRGSVALIVSVERITNGQEERLEHFVLKEPNLARKEGWTAVRETFETPAGTIRLRLKLGGRFRGEVELAPPALLRR
jgi:diadenosine tetraphosphatase ApaH/serine/threonine PP2A family protein phosphatase